MFKKATKKQVKTRVLLEGASGSGKTWSALLLGEQIAAHENSRIAFIDTEKESASLYSDRFDFDTCPVDPPFTPEKYIDAIKGAEEAGYKVIVIDSLSHEWIGEGGCLDIHGKMTGNSFANWRTVTPRHDKFVNAILYSSSHIVATCRSQTEYELADNERGKKVPTKQGTKPKQRDGLDYEMTLVFTLNQNHMAAATKDRTGIFTGKDHVIGEDTGKRLLEWLNCGEKVLPVSQRIEQAKTEEELIAIWNTLNPTEKETYKPNLTAKKGALANG